MTDNDSQDEKRQRQMDFILEQQAHFTVDIQQLKESHAELQRTQADMQRTQADMQRTQAEMQRTLATHIEHSNTVHQRSMEAIYALTESQDRTTLDVRNLTTVVDRVADAVVVLLEREAGRKNENGS